MSAREIYETSIRPLPAIDRLRLASMIIDELATSATKDLDISDEWTEEDLADFKKHAMKHLDESIGEENNGF